MRPDYDHGKIESKVRRDKERRQKKHDNVMRKAILREKDYWKRDQEKKETAKRMVPLMRERRHLRAKHHANEILANEITIHVITQNDGIMSGDTLTDIYEMLSAHFSTPVELIMTAVDYACHKEWLEQSEGKGSRGTTWTCSVPILEPDHGVTIAA